MHFYVNALRCFGERVDLNQNLVFITIVIQILDRAEHPVTLVSAILIAKARLLFSYFCSCVFQPYQFTRYGAGPKFMQQKLGNSTKYECS